VVLHRRKTHTAHMAHAGIWCAYSRSFAPHGKVCIRDNGDLRLGLLFAYVFAALDAFFCLVFACLQICPRRVPRGKKKAK
jgi:hypothetical protein